MGKQGCYAADNKHLESMVWALVVAIACMNLDPDKNFAANYMLDYASLGLDHRLLLFCFCESFSTARCCFIAYTY